MYKSILSSTLPLIITVLLFIVVGNYGVGRVLNLQSQISQARVDKATLMEKLNTLQTTGATVGSSSQATAAALTDKNPALIELTQLKSVAGQNTVSITNLKSGSEVKDTGGLSEVDISFDVTGPRLGIIAFLDGIEKAAPITLVDKIKLNENGGEAHATVTVNSFWAPFPKSLPPVTQAISELTPDEIGTLTKISALAQPQFVVVPPGDTGGKANPFAP